MFNFLSIKIAIQNLFPKPNFIQVLTNIKKSLYYVRHNTQDVVSVNVVYLRWRCSINKKDDLRKMMPLTETSFYVLIALLEPLHGYGIMKKVEKLSKGRILFGPGTLYGALNNLQSIGLISLCEDSSEDKGRKTYLITEKGKELVKLEIERLKEMIENAETLINKSSINN